MNTPLENALWIAADAACESPVILRRFTVEVKQPATLHITGLGYFEARLNGQPVSEDKFVPVITDYEPRPLETFGYPLYDTTTHRTYYYSYDVTRLLQPGENTLEIQLGNGFYRQQERIAEGRTDFGTELKTIFALQLGKELLCSDGSETWRSSEIVYSNMYIGERVVPGEAGTMEWPVHKARAPQTELCPAIGTPDRLIRTLHPVCLGEVNGKKIYDAGENISGIVEIATHAPAGEVITLRFAENLHADGSLDFKSTGEHYRGTSGQLQRMKDVFICDGTERSFAPKFVWHAFRYFDVEGTIDSAEVQVIHSDVPVTAEFESSCEGLNFLFDAYIRSQLDNMHGSIPSDCPHRERLGYTGDGQLCAPATMLLLDSKEFYRKWIVDILDCQDKTTGHVQHTAPLMGGGGGPGGWGCAMVLVPWAYYRQFGEKEMLETTYGPMRLWMDYLENHSENGLVTREEEGGWCLGDWCTLEPIAIPAPYVNSCYTLKCLRILCEIAAVLGCEEDIPVYKARIAVVSEAIEREYADGNGSYCGGVQGADAYAVWAGLAGEETARRVAEKYDALGHFDTGFLCTDILLEVLFDYGYADVACKLLQGDGLGSFLYMKRHGATTLWENWDGGHSHNHPMFGGCTRHLFSGILGIGGGVGYETLTIAPKIPAALEKAGGSVCLPVGKVSVAFAQKDGRITFDITVPAGVKTAFVWKNETRTLTGHEIFTL